MRRRATTSNGTTTTAASKARCLLVIARSERKIRPASDASAPRAMTAALDPAGVAAGGRRPSRTRRTYPENSDEANILLMASDMARGNLYLSGWNVSDVPFITTELPEIALLVKLFGLRLETAHIAAALTYTVVVALALLLAKGRAGGPRAIARMASRWRSCSHRSLVSASS
jgi:hypothetical protein